MFGKKKEAVVVQEVVEETPVLDNKKTVIGSGVTMEGTFEGSDPIVVNGTIKGTVLAENEVYISKEGKLLGDGLFNVLNVDGQVDGEFECKETATFNYGGKMTGKLKTKNFVSAPGSAFGGQLEIIPEGTAPAEKPAETPAAAAEE